MPTLDIGGRKVSVGDEFLSLSLDQQNATVDEIAKTLAGTAPTKAKAEPKLSDAVTDIPNEVRNAASESIDTIKKGVTNRGTKGPIEGLLDTGRAVMAVPALAFSPLTGAARSLIGHPMAQAEHAVGTIIAPEIAAKDDPQKMYETAKGDVDLAMSAAGSQKSPVVAPKMAAPSIAELKSAASGKPGLPGGYEGAELSSLEVKPAAITDFATQAKVALDAGGLDENLAPKTHAILTKLEKIPPGPSATVTGNNIKSLRQLLGNAAGEPGKEGLAAKRALDALDDQIPKIDPKHVISGDPAAAGAALDEANANYSAAKHAETIDNKTIRAEQRAAASNSGTNVANTVRQRFADILNPERPDLRRGFTADEISMMGEIVHGTPTQNTLRWAGNYLGGGGGLGALHTSGAGAAVGAAVAGPIGAAVGAVTPPAIGYLLKALGNRSTLKAAEQLSEAVRSRAPLASSLQKFHQSAQAFGATSTAKTYAGALIAARNLSMNLRDAGINLAPSDLMKSLSAPGVGGAQDDDNAPRRE